LFFKDNFQVLIIYKNTSTSTCMCLLWSPPVPLYVVLILLSLTSIEVDMSWCRNGIKMKLIAFRNNQGRAYYRKLICKNIFFVLKWHFCLQKEKRRWLFIELFVNQSSNSNKVVVNIIVEDDIVLYHFQLHCSTKVMSLFILGISIIDNFLVFT